MKTLIRLSLLAAVLLTGLSTAAYGASPLLKELEDAFVSLSEEVRPSVVEIASESTTDMAGGRGRLDELFRFFIPRPELPMPENHPRTERRSRGTGSGFIYDRLGHIITNNHVVDGADRLMVELASGERREATVVGTDPSTDIAVIKIDPEGLDLRPVRFGDSDTVKVGHFAIAIGSPRGQTGSLAYGHISGLRREDLRLPTNLRFQGFIQTDAGINLGNSGGPLCNIDGDVIGVNVAIVYGANSIGFAIPINRVKEIVPQLIASGKVVRGWLGVGIRDVATAAEVAEQEVQDYVDAFRLPDDGGTMIATITWGGPAERAELKPDDVIRKIDGVPVADTHDLIDRISAIKPGTRITLEVWRKGERLELPVVVDEFPGRPTALYGKAYLGIHVTTSDSDLARRLRIETSELPSEVFVPVVTPDSPADQGGIRPGDFLIEVAQRQVKDRENFKRLLRVHARPGKTLLIRTVTLGGEPEEKFVKVPDDFSVD